MASEEQEPGVNPPEGEAAPAGEPASNGETAPAPPPVEAGIVPAQAASGDTSISPQRAEEDDNEDGEEDGMLRMSFLGHLEELRVRIIRALLGIGVAFGLCLFFAKQLFAWLSAPIISALKDIGADANLYFNKPVEAFSMIWMKAPMLAALFVAAPWVLYQVWAFIAPGLYKRERRWAAPFVISTASLFVLGGLFAYYIGFRFALQFLLGFGQDINIKPLINVSEYFNLFVNVTIGIGFVFELPVLLFFLTLLHIVSPRFLMRNTRYAVLIIVVIAAIVTPTPDVFNLALFAVPMILLYFIGVFASYLLVLHREKRRFPWGKVLYTLFALLLAAAVILWLAVTKYGYHWAPHWPFLTR